MDTLKALHCFVRAVELGSLSAVARESGSSQPTVSKTMAALERQIGAQLLIRSTTRVHPTEQGRRFYEHARQTLESFADGVSEARGETEQVRGRLRVSAPVSLGVLRLNALLLEFMALHPEVELELLLNDRFVDLAEEGIDLALRLGGELPDQLVARPLARSPRYLVAAPSYLARLPTLERPEDLPLADYLRFTWLDAGQNLLLRHADGRELNLATRSRYTVNSSLAIRESYCLAAGFGLTPAWLVADLLADGTLQRLLVDWHGPTQEANLLYPSRRHLPARTRTLIDFLLARVPCLPGFEAL
ncbi:LysR family transcriptional regulator [Pseudomonas sp. PDNC002]|uniref:LysR family transcriptional regulator n=1 Tax=Pseudomonas sp. PDNC002 TaxID=2811422 RepID=UPI0019642545|nr:LysR family transcriptional regulator [Pseudomonas sp. PDNC002]QRY82233.1 LysR family transcriptional regulator [Pseudomonas sp. PDNC002]